MLFPEQTSQQAPINSPYAVFARKYRPQNFESLIGQEELVKTLTHALTADRVGHAYLFCGVRGVGKTTAARILAKALNCLGTDGKNTAPALEPCGVCDACVGIAESRHIDVFEMDAASRTGIDDVREIIESVKYKPVRARYKIFIIDETHMLSKQAFNGFLKTLEEPPPHVKFIFATTEVQKIPVTVLSRCQKIELKKISAKDLQICLRNVCEREALSFEPEALTLLVRAAAGSARDALSLLDRAVSCGAGSIVLSSVREMLGGSDETILSESFDDILRGDTGAALKKARILFDTGGDPILFLKDLLRRTETLARLKHTGVPGESEAMTEEELEICKRQATSFETPKLSRFWSVLIEALSAADTAPDPGAVCEMALIRMGFGLHAPDPAQLLQAVSGKTPPTIPPAQPASAPQHSQSGNLSREVISHPNNIAPTETEPQNREMIAPPPAQAPLPARDLGSFEKLLNFLDEKRESLLKNRLEYDISVAEYAEGVIRYTPMNDKIDPRFVTDVKKKLRELTGKDWIISVADVSAGAGVSVADKKKALRSALKEKIEAHPFMLKIKENFPGSVVEDVRPLNSVSYLPEEINLDEDQQNDRE